MLTCFFISLSENKFSIGQQGFGPQPLTFHNSQADQAFIFISII